MKSFNLFGYLKKFSIYIAMLSLLAGVLFYFVVNRKFQQYTAVAVIRYNNSQAEKGIAPDGTDIDVSEISASNIIIQVMQNLGMDVTKTNMDSIRNHIKVTGVVTSEEKALQQSKLDDGEEYIIHPVEYIVSYSAPYSAGEQYPRTMLNEILEVYSEWYGQNHVNTSGASNDIKDVTNKEYDYLEMTEMISSSLDRTLESLGKKRELNSTFRSYDTGYSFVDIYREFDFIKEEELPLITSTIINDRITKNRDVLLTKYKARNESLLINNNVSKAEIDRIREIIDTYVKMMSESGNTNITNEYILQEVYQDWYTKENGAEIEGDSTVQYDRLLKGYIERNDEYAHNLLNYGYNTYIIDRFTGAPAKSPEKAQQEIQERIEKLVSKINHLYVILDSTNDEFNEYLGGHYIMQLSSVGVSTRFSAPLFTALVIILFGVIGCVFAVIIGRIQDFVEYYAFTDKVDGLPNRSRCDIYLNDMESKHLFGDFVCVVYKITNLRDINAKFGREKTDRILKEFVSVMTAEFKPSDKIFVGNNGSGQYLIFASGVDYEHGRNSILQIGANIEEMNSRYRYELQYSVGIKGAKEEKCHSIRKLLSMTMNSLVSIFDFKNGIMEPAAPAESGEEQSRSSGQIFTLNEDYYNKFMKSRKHS